MNILALNTPTRRFVSSCDLDELHRAISQVIEPPQFFFLGSPRNSNMDISRLQLPRAQIFGVKTTASVRVLHEVLLSVQVTVPLQGAILASSGSTEKYVLPGEALIHIAGEPGDIVRQGACKTVFVRVEPKFLVPLISDPNEGQGLKPRFGLHVVSIRNGLGKTMINLVNQICAETSRIDAESIQDHEFDKILNHILALIITQNRFVDVAEQRNSLKFPRYLNRAVEFVHENLEQDLSLVDLTAVAHMSARTLQRAFVSQFGKGPLKFIKHARLRRVREELMNSSPYEKSVSQVAVKWGFHHTGNFARDYVDLFGERPRETLRKS